MAESSRILNSTIHKYIRKMEVNVLRERAILATLESKGLVTFNNSGDLVDWKVRYKLDRMQGYADGDVLTASRPDRIKTAQLPWRAYAKAESIGKFEKLKNSGFEAIVNLTSNTAEWMMEEIRESFGDEIYKDGNLAANIKGIHGLESIYGNSGAATNGYIASPSATYAGLSTILGNYGGSWSTSSGNSTWPIGTGDSHYDFWSPLIVDYTDTAWEASTDTWANNCFEAVRFGITHIGKNKALSGQMDMIMLSRELFRQFKNKMDPMQRLELNRGEGSGLWALGFKGNLLNFEGIDMTTEYGIPEAVGYGLCTSSMELMSMQATLFDVQTPDFDVLSKADRLGIDFFGNLRIKSPRQFVKWVNVT